MNMQHAYVIASIDRARAYMYDRTMYDEAILATPTVCEYVRTYELRARSRPGQPLVCETKYFL